MYFFRKMIRKMFGSKRRLMPEDNYTGMGYIDLRSEKERRKESEIRVKGGQSLGSEVDGLVDELVIIGHRDGFLEMGREQTRTIGTRVNSLGGKKLMLEVHYRVSARLGGDQASELEHAWNYIGDWRS